MMDADDAGQSVYQHALGEDFASLDPRLQRYFGAIPRGSVGTGSGIYEVAGSRVRVLRPLFALMARRHVLFPELGRDVPFAVTNTPGLDGSLSAVRSFEFEGRTRVMEDTMCVVNGLLHRNLRLCDRGVRLELTVWPGHSSGVTAFDHTQHRISLSPTWNWMPHARSFQTTTIASTCTAWGPNRTHALHALGRGSRVTGRESARSSLGVSV